MYNRQLASSIAGYLGDIFSPQLLHLPLRNRKLNTGTRSYHLSLELQLVQCDGGKEMLSPLGILYIHTFKKLPIRSPNTLTNI
jgi:hypothetical protein